MFPPDLLAGRVALVTGAGRGIGRAIAEALAAAGADLWVNARKPGAVDDMCAELSARHAGTARPVYFDVADPAAVKAGFMAVQKESRRLDILVNNAGVMRDSLFEMATVEQIDEMLDVNLRGVIICSQYGARLMARAGGGSIVNITSMVGRFGNAGQVVYGASKAGVIGVTQGLAKELAARRIRVNAIAPGVIDTDLIADLPEARRAELLAAIGLGRTGTPADIAPTAVYLASPMSAYVTGQVIGVDGGCII